MKILRAGHEHRDEVLKLLDDFRTECASIIYPEKDLTSNSAKESGGPIFDEVIDSPNCGVFIAKTNNIIAGIISVYKIPQIRNGENCAEIEELYVIPKFRGRGIAKMLMDSAINWAKENNISSVRLESSNELKDSHKFYEKSGFRFYARGYLKNI